LQSKKLGEKFTIKFNQDAAFFVGSTKVLGIDPQQKTHGGGHRTGACFLCGVQVSNQYQNVLFVYLIFVFTPPTGVTTHRPLILSNRRWPMNPEPWLRVSAFFPPESNPSLNLNFHSQAGDDETTGSRAGLQPAAKIQGTAAQVPAKVGGSATESHAGLLHLGHHSPEHGSHFAGQVCDLSGPREIWATAGGHGYVCW